MRVEQLEFTIIASVAGMNLDVAGLAEFSPPDGMHTVPVTEELYAISLGIYCKPFYRHFGSGTTEETVVNVQVSVDVHIPQWLQCLNDFQ